MTTFIQLFLALILIILTAAVIAEKEETQRGHLANCFITVTLCMMFVGLFNWL